MLFLGGLSKLMMIQTQSLQFKLKIKFTGNQKYDFLTSQLFHRIKKKNIVWLSIKNSKLFFSFQLNSECKHATFPFSYRCESNISNHVYNPFYLLKGSVWPDLVVDLRMQHCREFYLIKGRVWSDLVVDLRMQHCIEFYLIKGSVWPGMVVDLRMQHCREFYLIKGSVWPDMVVDPKMQHCILVQQERKFNI